MEGIFFVVDYFLICYGNFDKQVQVIVCEIKDQVEENGIDVKKMEGFDEVCWILVDFGDVIVYVFYKDERGYYNFEKLWGDVLFVEFEFGLNL